MVFALHVHLVVPGFLNLMHQRRGFMILLASVSLGSVISIHRQFHSSFKFQNLSSRG